MIRKLLKRLVFAAIILVGSTVSLPILAAVFWYLWAMTMPAPDPMSWIRPAAIVGLGLGTLSALVSLFRPCPWEDGMS